MKKNLIQELARMKELAGIKLNENSDEEKSIQQAADKIANSSIVQDKLEDQISKLSDEQIQALKKDIEKTIHNLEQQPKNNEDVMNEADSSSTSDKVSDHVESAASGITASLLVPIIPVAVGAVVGSVAAGFGITGLAIAALYGIAEALRKMGK